MHPDFWRQCWKEGKTGWQLPQPHAFLERHGNQLFAQSKRVFIPLCGASPDIFWFLDRGIEVVGVELVEDAVAKFFNTANLSYVVKQTSAGHVYQSEGLEIVVADYFSLPEGIFSACDMHYDRAAIIAMPPSIQPSYVQQLKSIAPKLAMSVWIGLVHDGGEEAGPPFSTPFQRMHHYCEGRLRLVEEIPVELKKSSRTQVGVGQLPKFSPDMVYEYLAVSDWQLC